MPHITLHRAQKVGHSLAGGAHRLPLCRNTGVGTPIRGPMLYDWGLVASPNS